MSGDRQKTRKAGEDACSTLAKEFLVGRETSKRAVSYYYAWSVKRSPWEVMGYEKWKEGAGQNEHHSKSP